MYIPGIPIRARSTQSVINSNVRPGVGRGYITYVHDNVISFYIDRGNPGEGWIDGICSKEIFAANFEFTGGEANQAYAASKPNTKIFPEHFLMK